MKRKYRSLVLTLIVLLSATVPTVGAAPDAEFDSDKVEVTASETVDITVALSKTDAAVVTIGSEQVNYIATVVARDGNGDGTVTLRYSTSNAGHGGAFSVADDADNATVESETDFDADHLLAAGAYDLSVAPGSDASTNNETDAATLVVTEQSKTPTATTTTDQALQDETTQKTVEPSQDSSVPGFGLVTGVLALAASGLLIRRRD